MESSGNWFQQIALANNFQNKENYSVKSIVNHALKLNDEKTTSLLFMGKMFRGKNLWITLYFWMKCYLPPMWGSFFTKLRNYLGENGLVSLGPQPYPPRSADVTIMDVYF